MTKLLVYDQTPIAFLDALPTSVLSVQMVEQYICEALSYDEGLATIITITDEQAHLIRTGVTLGELGIVVKYDSRSD